MATTTNGLPYPVGTDKVVDGDDAIRALAESVDAKVLPFGHVRARCTTAASAGPGAWNICWLDVFADAKGAQPWTLEASSRRVKITKAGVYSLSASITMNGVCAVGIAISSDGSNWDRVAATGLGTINYSNSVATTRYLAANTYVCMMMYHSTALNTVADAVGSPCFIAFQALGGQ